MMTRTLLAGASAVCLGLAVLVLTIAAVTTSGLQFVALLALASLFVLAATTFTLTALVLFVARGVRMGANAAFEKGGDSLWRWTLEFEETNGIARAINLSQLVTPVNSRALEKRVSRALDETKSRYADGLLTDTELEAELARLVELEESVVEPETHQ